MNEYILDADRLYEKTEEKTVQPIKNLSSRDRNILNNGHERKEFWLMFLKKKEMNYIKIICQK